MKLHRVIALVLTLGVLGVFCVTALTTSYDPQTNMCSYIECTDGEEKAAGNATNSFSGDLAGEYVCYDMKLQDSYGYWRMTVTNTGNTDLQVNVNGQVFRVPAQTAGYLYSTSRWEAGTYSVGFSSKVPGVSMDSTVSCTLYATLEESQP